MSEALVVIPTYDEAHTISGLLQQVLALSPELDVLVVDDASPDGTGALVAALAAVEPRVHLLSRAGKQGLGAAYRAGFRWALDHNYAQVAQMDADLSHPPQSLPALLGQLGSADVAIGSRYVPGGATCGWPLRRQVLSRAGNTYARRALHIPVADVTAGFRAYRREVLTAIGLATVTSGGYCFQIELTLRALQAGFEIAEVPITFTERVDGNSKMGPEVVREAFTKVTGWALAGGLPDRHQQHPASIRATLNPAR